MWQFLLIVKIIEKKAMDLIRGTQTLESEEI